MKSIKEMLREDRIIAGLMVEHITAPWIAKVYSDAGSDFMFIEYEHALFNGTDLANLVLCSRLCDMPVVAKCPYVDRGEVTKLLDAGVTGIQLPMTETAEQISRIVSFCKFPPEGIRAASPGIGNTSYEHVDTVAWLKRSNDETSVIAHIETAKALENIDSIAGVQGVDILFIGMFDLSVSLGHPAQFRHPAVVKAMEALLDAAHKYDKVAGMWAPDFDTAEYWMGKGVRFFELTGDVGFISDGARSLMSKFPGHAPGLKGYGGGHI